jgi:hypothetical protein
MYILPKLREYGSPKLTRYYSLEGAEVGSGDSDCDCELSSSVGSSDTETETEVDAEVKRRPVEAEELPGDNDGDDDMVEAQARARAPSPSATVPTYMVGHPSLAPPLFGSALASVLGPLLSLTVSPASIDELEADPMSIDEDSPRSARTPLLPVSAPSPGSAGSAGSKRTPSKSSLKPARSFSAPISRRASLWTLPRRDAGYTELRPRRGVTFAPRATYLTIMEHHAPSWVRSCARTTRPVRDGTYTLGMQHQKPPKLRARTHTAPLARVSSSGVGVMGMYDDDGELRESDDWDQDQDHGDLGVGARTIRRARTWIHHRVRRHTA